MGRLTDRVILITGSTGIAAAAAAAAVRARSEGASIFIVSRTAEHARALAMQVDGGSRRRLCDGPIHTVTGDAWDATEALPARLFAFSPPNQSGRQEDL